MIKALLRASYDSHASSLSCNELIWAEPVSVSFLTSVPGLPWAQGFWPSRAVAVVGRECWGACSKAIFVSQAGYFNMLQINKNNKYLKVFLFMFSIGLRKNPQWSISTMCCFNLGVLGRLMKIMMVLTPKIFIAINTSWDISLTLQNCLQRFF